MQDESRTASEVLRDVVPIAHARRRADGSWDEPHLLSEHLTSVARLAQEFSYPFKNGDWGYLAGLWHDLGKYKADFQSYIRNASGFDRDEADEGGPGKVDHTTAGAIHAVERLGPPGRILAYLIAGHHSGLPDWYKEDAPGRSLGERLADRQHLAASLQGAPPPSVLDGAPLTTIPCGGGLGNGEHAHLWVRMLFSCLVDADFLDTEAYMDPSRSSTRQTGGPDLAKLKHRFDAHMTAKQADAPPSLINEQRRLILEDCRRGAESRPGLFSLTVPTGGGKTLASVGFALEHALRFQKRRIIIAIPYTSIIEQTAEVLRAVFGDEAVVEHHSNLDPERETRASKLATENWDAPIIVTTNVQLFESLYAARTSAGRKVHNLVDSVVILDEAQMLPPEFLQPILSALRGLTTHFGVSAVLCTATQPALVGRIGGAGRAAFDGLSNVMELVRDPDRLSQMLRRVDLTARDVEAPATWEGLAAELSRERQVLCIVNTRKDCRDLHSLMPEGTVHLSALMCGEHRSRVIREIKERLRRGDETRVVSTQLVEAGVDLDFPVVFRAMAGLDSIAQAAGRCNREGRLPNGQLGRVVVFAPPRPAPLGLLRRGEDACREMFRTNPELVTSLSPTAFRSYFQNFYGRVERFDAKDITNLLTANSRQFHFQFRTAAQRFRLVDDQGQKPIIVWYEGTSFDSRKLLDELRYAGPHRALMRRLQRATVNVPERVWRELVEKGAVEEIRGPDGPLQIWVQAVPGLYDQIFGLRLEGPSFQGDEFVC